MGEHEPPSDNSYGRQHDTDYEVELHHIILGTVLHGVSMSVVHSVIMLSSNADRWSPYSRTWYWNSIYHLAVSRSRLLFSIQRNIIELNSIYLQPRTRFLLDHDALFLLELEPLSLRATARGLPPHTYRLCCFQRCRRHRQRPIR